MKQIRIKSIIIMIQDDDKNTPAEINCRGFVYHLIQYFSDPEKSEITVKSHTTEFTSVLQKNINMFLQTVSYNHYIRL